MTAIPLDLPLLLFLAAGSKARGSRQKVCSKTPGAGVGLGQAPLGEALAGRERQAFHALWPEAHTFIPTEKPFFCL